jgi:hypothetical protein
VLYGRKLPRPETVKGIAIPIHYLLCNWVRRTLQVQKRDKHSRSFRNDLNRGRTSTRITPSSRIQIPEPVGFHR